MKNCVLSQNGKVITFSDENIFFGLTTTQFGDFSSDNGNAENSQEKIKNLTKKTQTGACLHITPRHDSAMSLVGEVNNEFSTSKSDVLLLQNYIGIIHCSYITLADKIIEKAMPYMEIFFNSNIKNIKAIIYSGICQKCYEVGKDVFDAFNQNSNYKKFFKKNGKPKKYQLDLAGLIKYKLVNLGVSGINTITICSHHNTFKDFNNNGNNKKILFSHRRQEMERNLIFCKLQGYDVLLSATTGNCPYVILY